MNLYWILSCMASATLGFLISAILSVAAKAEKEIIEHDIEEILRNKIAIELASHSQIFVGESYESEYVVEVGPERIGFNLGLIAAGIIVNAKRGEKISVNEQVSEDGYISYNFVITTGDEE